MDNMKDISLLGRCVIKVLAAIALPFYLAWLYLRLLFLTAKLLRMCKKNADLRQKIAEHKLMIEYNVNGMKVGDIHVKS